MLAFKPWPSRHVLRSGIPKTPSTKYLGNIALSTKSENVDLRQLIKRNAERAAQCVDPTKGNQLATLKRPFQIYHCGRIQAARPDTYRHRHRETRQLCNIPPH